MKAKDIKVTLAIVGTVLVLSGCATALCEQCSLPATGQGDWYRNNGLVATCDDFAGFNGLTDVPPGQDGRFMAGCPTEGRFEVNGPLVEDSCTGLTWQKTTTSPRTWVEALIFARNLELGGFDNWRLPNINELLSLVDYGRHAPTIDPVFEILPPTDSEPGGGGSDLLWSSTSHDRDRAAEAWAVNFLSGESVHTQKGSGNAGVRAVRGGFIPRKQPVIACEAVIGP